jgi:O-antigen ligase
MPGLAADGTATVVMFQNTIGSLPTRNYSEGQYEHCEDISGETNERPNLQPTLAAIVLVQGAVAIAQFLQQGDLGLIWLGELPLNPIFEGVSVIVARNQPWLRAYGLTAHPNLLGAILTALLLLLLPTAVRSQGWRRIGWYAAFLVGLAGLTLTFSRSAGLAFLGGLLTWLLLRNWPKKESGPFIPRISSFQPLLSKYLKFILPALLFISLFLLYSDLFLSRLTNLDAPSEAQSLNQRIDDARLALQLIAKNPLTGVGLGSYTDVAQTVNPQAARVHNVLLLVTAELGLPGLLPLLWLLLAPLTFKGGFFFAEGPVAPDGQAKTAAVLVRATRQAKALEEMRQVAETLSVVKKAR